jgi:hypothetical protein
VEARQLPTHAYPPTRKISIPVPADNETNVQEGRDEGSGVLTECSLTRQTRNQVRLCPRILSNSVLYACKEVGMVY